MSQREAEHETLEATPEDAPLMPLGVSLLSEGASGEEDPFDATPKRGPRRIVVAGLVLVGAAAGIFAMRAIGMGPGAALAGLVLDFKPGASGSTEVSPRLLADLERSKRAVQVPAEVIDKDPFRLRTDAGTPLMTDDPEAIARAEAARQAKLLEEQRLERERRQRELQTAFGRFELQGIMGGTMPIARISGKLVRVGDMLEGGFKVTQIEGRRVVLVAEDTEFVLEFGTPSSQPRTPPRTPPRRN
ncbi:MAG: hypothetical protein DYG93_06525 [Leptolyngbya sp. PLA2]|nr:hypothetical protein [Leptolyngbya sp.]MCE7971304.1 hypothetical protein [Leptolyngbya sp. PL-A2]MCQ3939663.1 hypothetical protein [cyanobacterium CYA1]MCZ7632091.1 hypothetical protein [Phycisphaerales bacterium]MDL1903920.1 hypothetical protein [Synechococcales cyanobacterium CNB]GIK18683.1 MAG: hypothetical protein BroJett004_08470 [Planctomycetota bacterium]